MGTANFIQTSLNRGELDPRIRGRTDIDAYFNGLQQALNVRSIPQGGMVKRPGQRFLGKALGNGRLENFSFSTEQNYLLVFTDLRVQIYRDGILQTNINGSGDDFLVTPYAFSQLQELDFIQSADTAIIVHPDVAPQILSRTSDTDWDITAAPLLNIPQFDFRDGLSPTPVSEIQTLQFNNYANGDTYTLSLEGVETDDLTYNGGDTADTAEQIQDELQRLPITGTTGISVVFTAGTTYTVTFADDSAKDWKLLTGRVQTGTGNIDDNSITVNRTQTGTARTEDVWSATRGWPATCTFHEGRLWFGGSKSRVQTVWGSRVNEFFNFDFGRSRDDEAIAATLDTDQVNAIRAIFSNRSLQVYTSGGEFAVLESPVTPENVAFLVQSNLGAARVRPTTIDGFTLFVQRTGRSINQSVFLDEFKANQSQSITTLASHIIFNPLKLASFKGDGALDANYVYILNDNGKITVFNTLSVENVNGYSRWETAPTAASDGIIRSIAVVDDQLNLLIERETGGGTAWFIEVEDDRLNTDAAVIDNVGGSDTLTGLDHLEGETVDVKADGSYQGEFVVNLGQVTIGRDADIIEAGLAWRPVIETMPLSVNLGQGPNQFRKKKIARIGVEVFESNGVIVNDQRYADKTIGLNQFDNPTPQTKLDRIYVLGWDTEKTVTITQEEPMDMTILSIFQEVAT